MKKEYINLEVKKYLAEQFYCSIPDLSQNNTIYTMNKTIQLPYIKIMTYNQCVVICISEDIYDTVKNALSRKNRDEIFEFPFVYGQTIHYIPDVEKLEEPLLPDNYSYELLMGDELKKLVDIEGFDNSLVFDEDGNTLTEIVFLAKKENEIVGIAGAGAESNKLWEVGVDVKPEYRNGRLGTKLISRLSIEIMKRDIVPFYSASVTNIGSQMVASRSGYIPCWVDTYGNILDGSSIYEPYVNKMKL